MNPIKVKMYCPIHYSETIVYCYKIDRDFVVSNGCDNMSGSPICTECCKKSIDLAKKQLVESLDNFPFGKK